MNFDLKKPKGMQHDAPPPILLKKTKKEEKRKGGGRPAGASVGEPLAGFFPAAGGAPHVAVLHPVHLAAFLPLAAHLPAAEHRRRTTGEQVSLRWLDPERSVRL